MAFELRYERQRTGEPRWLFFIRLSFLMIGYSWLHRPLHETLRLAWIASGSKGLWY